MTTPVAEAAAGLRRVCLEALVCVPIPDTDTAALIRAPSGSHSQPPGNWPALTAAMDIHTAVRDIERRLYREVTGREPQPRGGSDRNTFVSIDRIADLGNFAADPRQLARELHHAAGPAERLPAIDIRDTWVPIRLELTCPRCHIKRQPHGHELVCPNCDSKAKAPLCPYCETPQLRLARRAYVVMCWYPHCEDLNGDTPFARLDVNRLDGTPILIGNDGSTW